VRSELTEVSLIGESIMTAWCGTLLGFTEKACNAPIRPQTCGRPFWRATKICDFSFMSRSFIFLLWLYEGI
jgi:hypothetical protein